MKFLLAAVLSFGPAVLAAQTVAPTETELVFPSGELRLHGTLTLPAGAGPHPAVVIVPGSGSIDRHGDAIGGGRPHTYALLAEALAARGIATLRYDKRGLPSTEGTVDRAALTVEDTAGDAAAAVRALAARADLRGVYLLGHSEGGTLALLAARAGAPARGLILVATMGRKFRVVLREQLAGQFSAEIMARFDRDFETFVATEDPVTPPPLLAAFFHPATRRYVRSWEAVDPVARLAGLTLPVLVVQGDTDVQITPEDARRLAAARPGIELRILPGVNHMLKEATGTTAFAQLRAYNDPTLPLAPAVVPAIADWLWAELGTQEGTKP